MWCQYGDVIRVDTDDSLTVAGRVGAEAVWDRHRAPSARRTGHCDVSYLVTAWARCIRFRALRNRRRRRSEGFS